MIALLRKRPFLTIIIVFFLYMIAALYCSPYPKGSDQYWNTSNIDRVVHGDGLYRTNNIFPASMPDSISGLPRPWVQNRPVVYVAASMAYVFRNANASFVILNCVLLFISAFLLYRLMIYANTLNRDTALFLTMLFLVFPINFYLVTQALPEIFNEFLAISIAYLLIFAPRGSTRSILVAFVCGGLIYQRDTNILLVPFIALYYIFFSKKTAVTDIIILAIVTFLCIVLKPYLLPSHTIKPLDAWAVITNVRPGTSDMINYLYKELPVISIPAGIKIIAQKFLSALKFQFIPAAATGIFFWLINLLLIALIAVVARWKRLPENSRRLLFISVAFVLLHFATVILFRNQYRFAAIIIPSLFIALLLAIDQFKSLASRSPKFLLIAGLVFVAIDAVSGFQNRRAAIKENKEVQLLREAKEKFIGDQALLVHRFDAANSLIAAYAFSPNYVYYFPGDNDINELFRAGKALNTDLLVLKKDTKVYERFIPYIIQEQLIDKPRKLVLVKFRAN